MSKINIPKVQTINSVSSKNYHFSKVTSSTNEKNEYQKQHPGIKPPNTLHQNSYLNIRSSTSVRVAPMLFNSRLTE